MLSLITSIWNAIVYSTPQIILGLAILATAAAVVAFAPPAIVDAMMRIDVRAQSNAWATRFLHQLKSTDDAFVIRGIASSDQARMIAVTTASDVIRISLYDRDGTVFWSSRPEELGDRLRTTTINALRADLDTVYEQATVSVDERRYPALVGGQPSRTGMRNLVHVFVPIVSSTFRGVVGYTKDVTRQREIYIERIRVAIGILVGLGLLLVAVVSLLSVRHGRATVELTRKRFEVEQELLNKQLKLSRELSLLRDLNEWIQTARSLDELFVMVSKFMRTMLPTTEGSLYLYAHSRDALEGVAAWNDGYLKDAIKPEDCWGMRRGTTYAYEHDGINLPCAHKRPGDTRSSLCFPILAHGEAVGLIHLVAKEEVSATPLSETMDLARSASEQISMAIANVRMRDELRDQSVRDSLTGLYNRRYVADVLRRALSHSRRATDSLAVISVDIDHFKRFNDNHGHDAGDMVLRAVGTVLADSCQAGDVAGRIGGEEFTLLWPRHSSAEALERAEALRMRVRAITVRYGASALPTVTVSIGIAIAPRDGRLPQEIMRAADDALYRAKRTGRDRVVLVEELQTAEHHEEGSSGFKVIDNEPATGGQRSSDMDSAA
ncbi:MAG: sensor domain-containing diguanylate cyclase [Pseudomonadota bacterium]